MLIRITDFGTLQYAAAALIAIGGAGFFVFWGVQRWKKARRSRNAVVYSAAAGNGLMAIALCWIWWRVATGEPPLTAALGDQAVELRYRWRTEQIAYADIQEVRQETRRRRRGGEEIHLRIVTLHGVHSFVVIPAPASGEREAVALLARELRDRLGKAER